MIGSHGILDIGGFGLVSLFLLVAIHDGDGHDEETNIDLREGGREGGTEGGREGGREGWREGGTEGGREGGRRDWEIKGCA